MGELAGVVLSTLVNTFPSCLEGLKFVLFVIVSFFIVFFFFFFLSFFFQFCSPL